MLPIRLERVRRGGIRIISEQAPFVEHLGCCRGQSWVAFLGEILTHEAGLFRKIVEQRFESDWRCSARRHGWAERFRPRSRELIVGGNYHDFSHR
jgi:hypothetical protein